MRFNEAPIHESGKFTMDPKKKREWTRFNEAPIHESGKSLPCRAPTRTRTCFNEAPIHESGKEEYHTHKSPDLFNASMRPRFMNRGSVGWGRETSRPTMASMRPRFMNRGSSERSRESGPALIHASMRPRFMNRGSSSGSERPAHRPLRFNEAPIHESGKSHIASLPRATEPASMRPRFMNRGSSWPRGYSRCGGSCFNEAPIHESGKSPSGCLRWDDHRGFNEAPIHESGKWRRRHTPSIDARSSLQ